MSQFLDLTKQLRYEEFKEELGAAAQGPWTWPRLFRLMEDLGLKDINGYMAAGWWVPVGARNDPQELDRLATRIEEAMAQGRFPDPGQKYSWDEVRRLGEICGLTPQDLVEALIWQYALTMGEEVFAGALRKIAHSPDK